MSLVRVECDRVIYQCSECSGCSECSESKVRESDVWRVNVVRVERHRMMS